MDERLKQYCEASKFFLINVSSIGECLLEFQRTQESLTALIALRAELEITMKMSEREYHVFMAHVRFDSEKKLKNNVMKVTEQSITDCAIKFNKEEYIVKSEQYDIAKMNYEVCNTLIMALFQRKDVIAESISFFKSKNETDSCVMKMMNAMKKIGL